jgi:hypothetical protein
MTIVVVVTNITAYGKCNDGSLSTLPFQHAGQYHSTQ